MHIEAASPDPISIARAVHTELKLNTDRVPVLDVAKALDVVAVQEVETDEFEAAVVFPPDRSKAVISVNSRQRPTRKRFSIGHELGHFLNVDHRPIEGGILCSKEDLTSGLNQAANLHAKQEWEANQFASHLLIRDAALETFIEEDPNLDHILNLSDRCGTSKAASASRYIDASCSDVAIVFAESGTVRYWLKSEGFPRVKDWIGDPLVSLPFSLKPGEMTQLTECHPGDWLCHDAGGELFTQTLMQAGGYSMTLIYLAD